MLTQHLRIKISIRKFYNKTEKEGKRKVKFRSKVPKISPSNEYVMHRPDHYSPSNEYVMHRPDHYSPSNEYVRHRITTHRLTNISGTGSLLTV